MIVGFAMEPASGQERPAWRIAVLALLASVVCLAPASAATPSHADVLFGEVVVQVFAGHGIGVTVDRIDADGPDGIADDVFVLEAHARIPPELPIRFEAARVVAREDRLVVISLRELRAVGLFLYDVSRSLVERELRVHARERHAEGVEPEVFLHGGHGLSWHDGPFALPLASWPPISLSEDPGSSGGNPTVQAASACDAGGQGSTSCSVTCGGIGHGCSVSCGSGYYACCKCGVLVASCSCVADGSSGGGSGGGGGGADCNGIGYCPVFCMSCNPKAY